MRVEKGRCGRILCWDDSGYSFSMQQYLSTYLKTLSKPQRLFRKLCEDFHHGAQNQQQYSPKLHTKLTEYFLWILSFFHSPYSIYETENKIHPKTIHQPFETFIARLQCIAYRL